tara:strand:+ start:1262 stop:1564 length:303 start_codon:yes stop_codon:yes gene_type:complete
MKKIYKVIAYLNANGKTYENERSKFELTDDNGVESITKWEISDLVEPTDTQLDALESEANTVKTDMENAPNVRAELKASAKAKLIAGEALTEEEANTIVL